MDKEIELKSENRFSIYISKCDTGWDTLYESDNLKLEDKPIQVDERTSAGQFVRKCEFYFVQILKNHKVYAIINTKDSDYFGRGGYSAIHLLSTNKYESISNFREILTKLSERFREHQNSNTINPQNYDDILELITTSRLSSSAAYFQGNKNFYTLYNANSINQIDSLFNSPNVFIASKIYAFNENDVLDEQKGENLSLYKITNDLYRKYKIHFDLGYLNSIQVNNSVINNPNSSPIVFYTEKAAIPEVSLGSKNRKEQILQVESHFHRQAVPPERETQRIPKKQKSKNKLLLPLLGIGFLLVAGLVFYKMFYQETEEINSNPIVQTTPDEVTEEISDTSSDFILVSRSKSGNDYYYTNQIQEIKEWCFKEDDEKKGTWYVYKSIESMKSSSNLKTFTKESLETVGVSVSDTIKWNQFADSLKILKKIEFPKFEKKKNITPNENISVKKDKKKEKNKEIQDKKLENPNSEKPIPLF